jgi:hypothetical protein
VAQVFYIYFLFGTLSIRKVVHLPAVHHKQKIDHKLDYRIATCQSVPDIQGLVCTKSLLDVTSTSACDHNPQICKTVFPQHKNPDILGLASHQ